MKEEKKEKEEKRLKVVPYGVAGDYKIVYIHFCLLSPPENDARQCATNISACRDYINDGMIADLHGKSTSYNPSKIDMTKLRLLFGQDFPTPEKLKEGKERAYHAKKIINMYEELGGFSGRTKIGRADFNYLKHCWILTGPKEWMKSSHLVSMLTLIIRAVTSYGGFNPDKIKSHKDLWNFWNNTTRNMSDAVDKRYLEHSFPLFPRYMVDYAKLFGKRTSKELMPEHLIHKWHSNGGIFHLSCGKTDISDLDEEILQIRKELGIKTNPFSK